MKSSGSGQGGSGSSGSGQVVRVKKMQRSGDLNEFYKKGMSRKKSFPSAGRR